MAYVENNLQIAFIENQRLLEARYK